MQNERVVTIKERTNAYFRPNLSITFPIIAPPSIYPTPKGIIAKRDNSSFSFGFRLFSMVSVIMVTKLPAKVARLKLHHIMPGRILLILFEINNLNVSTMFSLKLYSSSFTDAVTGISSYASAPAFPDAPLIAFSLSLLVDSTNIVDPHCILRALLLVSMTTTSLGTFNTQNMQHPPADRATMTI